MDTILHPIITTLFAGLSGLYHMTSDWGFAIILLTLLVRVLLFPFNLRTARQQLRQSSMQPVLAELKQKFAQDQARLLQETSKAYQQFGVKPLSLIAVSLIQAPLFLSLYRVFSTHGAAMTSHLVPWMSSLGAGDPFHLVPLLYAVVTFISMIVPLTSEIAVTGSWVSRMTLPLIMVMIMSAVMWSAPVAIGLYWMTNSLFAIVERGFYRTPIGRRWVTHGFSSENAASA
ncbi:YidC/Oxa1 family membrane protein insertase [Paenibacillus sp. GCM10027628]|uniref:YidC/Oxa1 family membrane protein insertase n=1 Tax=Paenibacillus sp. GCM10027628 TaxID=3273413 RepID=UPI00362509A2